MILACRMVIFTHSYPKMILWDSHEVSGPMGFEKCEEHGMLFEKGFDKSGTRLFPCFQNGNDGIPGTRNEAWLHVPCD